MSKVDYSADAVNVLSRFYRSSYVLYVEGDDDVQFWSKVFQEFCNFTIEVIPLGGAVEIDRKIKRIINEDLRVLAARDADHTKIRNTHVTDNRVVYTYGYAIENTLFTPSSVAEMLSVLARVATVDQVSVEQWFDAFFECSKNYLHFDLANSIGGWGVGLPDNCSGFMQSKKSCVFNQSKLESYLIKNFGRVLNDAEKSEIEALIARYPLRLPFLFRGHFLQSAVNAFISNYLTSAAKKSNCSYDAMYLGAIQSLQSFLSGDSEHAAHYRAEVEKVSAWGRSIA
ncbi:DUF4435 domain-containing protein [Pseudomonas sp. Irchel s3b6]|uniref:DUF4435 domain-containing protein n=1 Tax=Pseudomonas sp. Irchel s3b6 TaxID=2009078 RepID=UPI000BA4D566|nr:DUF4435 domain-containing protein [Pseudomonas sp. Irchel s3b6]